MELDKRIKNQKEIYTIITSDSAKNYLNNRGYFTCDITDFEDLSDMDDFIFTLMEIGDGNEPFMNENGDTFSYFLPLNNVSKPVKFEYRPLTLDEWKEIYHIGSIITFREKSNPDEVLTLMYTGFIETKNKETKIFLGTFCLPLKVLFANYEFFYNGRWKPFGFKTSI